MNTISHEFPMRITKYYSIEFHRVSVVTVFHTQLTINIERKNTPIKVIRSIAMRLSTSYAIPSCRVSWCMPCVCVSVPMHAAHHILRLSQATRRPCTTVSSRRWDLCCLIFRCRYIYHYLPLSACSSCF